MKIAPLLSPDAFEGIEGMTHLCTGGESPWLKSQAGVYAEFARFKGGSHKGRDKIETVKQACLQHANILDVSASFDPPGRGSDINSRIFRTKEGIESNLLILPVDPGFFSTYDIPILQGHSFTQAYDQVILTELAVKHMKLANPIGETLYRMKHNS